MLKMELIAAPMSHKAAPKTIVKPKNFEARGVYITHTVAGSGYIFRITKEMKKLSREHLLKYLFYHPEKAGLLK